MNYSLLLDQISRQIILTEDEQLYFISLLHTKKLRKKQFLNEEGDISKGPAFVVEGILRSYSLDKNGFEHVIQFAPQGWWVGDMYSIVKQQPGKLYIDAIEDSEILWLPKADMDKLYIKIPKFERFFRILAENSVINYQDRLIGNLSLTAMERYNHFCKQYPTLIQCLPQKQVASYIGVTPEFLSKTLNAPAVKS